MSKEQKEYIKKNQKRKNTYFNNTNFNFHIIHIIMANIIRLQYY